MKKRRKLKILLCVIAVLAAGAAGYFLISGWLNSLPKLEYALNKNTGPPAAYPNVNFAVISDLHAYDPSLGIEGAAFDEILFADRKLLRESIELLDYAINEILRSDAQFVLISGDLTKDGERVNHAILAEKLSRFTEAGLRVYVTPGNHDISNPDAFSYKGDNKTRVATVSPEDFTRIYGDFGYNQALFRDDDSLSYVAEPTEGLWVLAIDGCRYRENEEGAHPLVGGKISQQTADWLAGVLDTAQKQEKAVLVLQHHGIAEHWDGQRKLHPNYLLDDFRHFGRFLASYHVRLAFTGHYHAQDITEGVFGDTYIYDIETGSLVTSPCPIRYISIYNNQCTVRTDTIVEKLRPGTDFAAGAAAFVKKTVKLEAYNTLKSFSVSDKDAELIADAVGDAFAAHYDGDEDPAKRPPLDKGRLNLWGRIVLLIQQYVLDGLWRDLPPADNHMRFSLE